MTRALIIVDVQNDFLPGGSLGSPEGDQIIPVINEIQKKFDVVVATKDWHPANHGGFAQTHRRQPGEIINLDGLEQILWPVHCVEETEGAEFSPALETSHIDKIVYKGTQVNIDSYSCFFDNAHRHDTGMAAYLREKGVEEVYLAGIATDYCVKYSALDSLEQGFTTYVISDACAGINLDPDDSANALAELRAKGATILRSSDIKG